METLKHTAILIVLVIILGAINYAFSLSLLGYASNNEFTLDLSDYIMNGTAEVVWAKHGILKFFKSRVVQVKSGVARFTISPETPPGIHEIMIRTSNFKNIRAAFKVSKRIVWIEKLLLRHTSRGLSSWSKLRFATNVKFKNMTFSLKSFEWQGKEDEPFLDIELAGIGLDFVILKWRILPSAKIGMFKAEYYVMLDSSPLGILKVEGEVAPTFKPLKHIKKATVTPPIIKVSPFKYDPEDVNVYELKLPVPEPQLEYAVLKEPLFSPVNLRVEPKGDSVRVVFKYTPDNFSVKVFLKGKKVHFTNPLVLNFYKPTNWANFAGYFAVFLAIAILAIFLWRSRIS